MLMSYKITFCCCWKVKRGYQFLYIELGSIAAVSYQGLITLTEDTIYIRANFQGHCNDKFSEPYWKQSNQNIFLKFNHFKRNFDRIRNS